MPTLNYNELSELSVGKFVGCAVQSDKEILLEADMSNLDVELTVNGRAVDFQKVFSAFEKTLTGSILTDPVEAESRRMRVSRSHYEEIVQALNNLDGDIYSAGSDVADSFSSAADDAAEVAGERARDYVQEHAWGGDALQSQVSHGFSTLREAIENLEIVEE